MSSSKKHNYNNPYRKQVVTKSAFDNNPTLIINRYRTPSTYRKAVSDVLTAFHSGTPFNRAVDQVFALDPNHLNRNKLAEHTLKTIANDY